MKKITIEGKDKDKEYIVHDRLNIVGTALQFKCIDGMMGAVSLSMSKVTIEPYTDPKEWCVVFGLGSREFWHQKTVKWNEDTEALIDSHLTLMTAEKMAQGFNSAKQNKENK